MEVLFIKIYTYEQINYKKRSYDSQYEASASIHAWCSSLNF